MVIFLNDYRPTSWEPKLDDMYEDVAPAASSPDAMEDPVIPEMGASLGQVYALATQI